MATYVFRIYCTLDTGLHVYTVYTYAMCITTVCLTCSLLHPSAVLDIHLVAMVQIKPRLSLSLSWLDNLAIPRVDTEIPSVDSCWLWWIGYSSLNVHNLLPPRLIQAMVDFCCFLFLVLRNSMWSFAQSVSHMIWNCNTSHFHSDNPHVSRMPLPRHLRLSVPFRYFTADISPPPCILTYYTYPVREFWLILIVVYSLN